MDNKTDYQTAFDFMLEGDHEVVVFGVLKRLNVRPWHEHYQDLVQEGRLEFVDAYQKYPDQRDDEKQMLSYIYQSVKWRLLDKLRRSTRVSTPILRGGVETLTNLSFDDEALADVETKLIFNNVLAVLNEKEQLLIRGLYLEGKTMSQLSEDLKVSRKTLYVWRNQIKTKIKPIWGNILDG
ncbi:sigma-70 family RNA polymerase sigma factor [Fructilactobacillus sanfranciscensis]|uniref:sigma-70 family RNA polymerase sigma factor n=1 Tax=Fructilactobacillus sanfranciscensis TaxID=1625 RepID=UPI0031F8694E